MVTVSINTYQDADLLDECLASVRDHLPDATIQVVDGRYQTWPHGPDNSDDGTVALCEEYDTVVYHPIGPVENEAAKHRARRTIAPADERVLFLDADERLLRADADGLAADTDYRVRIYNALLYGPRISYYPRLFDPERMTVERVDKFMFDGPVQRTDAVTIVHRADLRAEQYRDAKLDRFETEERDSWYKDYLASLDGDLPDAEMHECPNCGQESVTVSRPTPYQRDAGDDLPRTFERVECCTAADSCYRNIAEQAVTSYAYLPDRVSEGFEKDLDRVKLELMAAGWDLAKVVPITAFDRYEPNARRWVEEHMAAEA